MVRAALYFCVLAAIAVALSSCGSSGASQDELSEARTEGAKEAQQQAKIEKIEGQLKSLKHGHGAPNQANTSGSSTPASSGNCSGSLSVGPNTTCAFAENVEYEYFAEIGSGSGTVTAYSPVTEKLYSMYCTAGEPHECSGGNNATVYFP
jgi:type II secretory pathway pseudopilin PulG